MIVVTGTNNIREGEKYEVELVLSHELYSSNNIRNDISLLKTTKDIAFSDLVKPINIRRSNVNSGEVAIASGWGLTSYPGSVPNDLQFIELRTLSNDQCRNKQLMGSAAMIYAGSLCTLTKRGEGMCMGDSGGPLVVGGELVGLVSWGIPCGNGYPDVFTRVSEFTNWVDGKMARYRF